MKNFTFYRGAYPAPSGGVVLHYVLNFLDSDVDVLVGPYDNGREQGYCISLESGQRSVSFSNYRSSDDIVVYPISGEADDAGMPNKKDCENRMFFPADSYRQAAAAALAWLERGEIKK